ncbi:MAG: Spy/CpxP family protein refolding chaperone [bacterium]
MMKTRKSLLALIMVISFSLGLGSDAVAQQPFKLRRQVSFRIEQFAQELDLSEEQLGKIRKLRLSAEIETIQKQASRKIAELELRELMQATDVTEGEVTSKVKEIGQFMTDIRLKQVLTRLAINKLLTETQRQKLRELESWPGRKRFHRGDRFRPGTPLDDLPGADDELGLDDFDFEFGESKPQFKEI